MSLMQLDSRNLLGTDTEYSNYRDYPADIDGCSRYPTTRRIRIIIGRLNNIIRMSAPAIDIVAEGTNQNEAWINFLCEAKKCEDSDWFIFDIGPTKREEIEEGLNVSEDEDWSEAIEYAED